MFIGQINQYQTHPYTNNIGIKKTNIASLSNQKPQSQYDRFEIGSQYQQNNDVGIYKPNQMKSLVISSDAWSKSENKQIIDVSNAYEILPPSEQSSYSEEDALINQYMKQYRIEGYFEDDKFTLTSSEPVRLILKENISKEDLDSFKNELIEKGLGTEIDWIGVRDDLASMNVGFDNIERFEQKADYLASRYAILKDRIQTQFTGDKQQTELKKLEQFYTDAKEEMANSYAESIGGFYEELGQSGVADDMRNSVLAMIDSKADTYTVYLKQNDIYSDITDTDKQWLKQDDAYMAAKLHESVSVLSEQQKTIYDKAPYNEKDLAYAGIYAKELSQQLEKPEWNIFTVKENDSDLGIYLAQQYKSIINNIDNSDISDKLSDILKDSFEPFIEKFMDALDKKIDHNRELIAENPWQAGLIRTNYIDRESVYSAFQNAISKV